MAENRIKSVEYSNKFLRSARRLPERIVNKVEEKEKLFRQDPFHSQLKTHKLSGKDKDCWAFSITDIYRIKFIFLSKEEVLFSEYILFYLAENKVLPKAGSYF